MTLTETVMRLVGPVKPLGATHVDDMRYKNLIELGELVASLQQELKEVAEPGCTRGCEECSVAKAARLAQHYLRELAQ